MAIEFHALRVSAISRETTDAVAVAFDLPSNLRETFKYKPGQYLTLRLFIDGKDVRRSYSLCSAPTRDGDPTIAVKQVEGGLASTYINTKLKVGDTIDVMPPLGNFAVDLKPYHAKHYVLIGAGSGITPLMSILLGVLDSEPDSRVTLLYGNRDKDSIIFNDQLQDLAQRQPQRFKLVSILSRPGDGWQGLRGRIEKDSCGDMVRSCIAAPDIANCWYYLCGPSGMMVAAQAALRGLGVPDDRVFREYFTTPLGGAGSADVSAAVDEEDDDPATNKSGFEKSIVKVRLYGIEHELEVAPGETILDVAVREEVDPPFACQIGACCTCRAKLLEGKVEMDEREALTDEEIEEGFILTCQSHPRSARLVVDYDQ